MNNIKLFVSIKNENEEVLDENLLYNKLIININQDIKITKLLKIIDEEYMSLFNLKNLHITSKLLDNYGYSLSNNCKVGDLLKDGDYITAIMDTEIDIKEEDKQSFNDIYENNFYIIRHFIEKILTSNINNENISEKYIFNIINFGLFNDIDLCISITKFLKKILLKKCIKDENVFSSIIYLLINKFLEYDNYYWVENSINIIEILSNYPYIIKEFNNNIFIGKLLYLAQKNEKFSNFKGRTSKIITYLNKNQFINNKGLLYKLKDTNTKPLKNLNNVNIDTKNIINNANFNSNNINNKETKNKLIYDKDEEFKISPYYFEDKEKYNNSQRHDFENNLYKIDTNNIKNSTINPNNRLNSNYQNIMNNYDYNSYSNLSNTKKNEINIKQNKFYDSLDKFQYSDNDNNINQLDEFLSLINPLNQDNLIEFGLENIKEILLKKPYISDFGTFKKLMRIFSLNINKMSEKYFNQIVEVLSLNLNDNQAEFLIKHNYIMKLLQSYNINNPSCKFYIKNFIKAILKQKGEKVDVVNIITILSSNDKDLKKIGIDTFLNLSQPKNNSFKGFCIQIESYVKDFLALVINEKDDYISEKLWEVLSNLCLNETLQSELIHLKVINILLINLRSFELYRQRMASKCLLNLSSKNSKYKLKILPELKREIELIKNNEIDRIVKSYILSILEN